MLKIKNIRERSNISQDEMVKRTGIPKRSYVNYENGKSDIPFSKLQSIASALNVKVQDFVENETTNFTSEEPKKDYQTPNNSLLLAIRDDIKQDLNAIAQGMTTNFETLNKGVLRGLQGQQKILSFIESINPEEITKGAKELSQFLKEHK